MSGTRSSKRIGRSSRYGVERERSPGRFGIMPHEISYTEMRLLDKLPRLRIAMERELSELELPDLSPGQLRKVEQYIEYAIVYGFDQGLKAGAK